MSAETFPFRLGAFSCVAINDASARYPLKMFLMNPPPVAELVRLGVSEDCSEDIEMSYNCLLVDTGRERVLIDTGFGPPTGKLRDSLLACGCDPHEIDIVIVTHLHPDHIGGASSGDGTRAFPRATHVVFKKERDYWSSDPALEELPVDASMKAWIQGAARGAMSTLGGHVRVLDEAGDIVPGIKAIEAFGHSPGHMAVEVSSQDRHLLFAADALLLPLNVAYPEARGVTDHQPAEMVRTRIRLLEHAARTGCLVGVSHFPFPGLGHVKSHERGWTWEPLPGEA